MKKFILGCVLLSGCATVPTYQRYKLCGNVDVVFVSINTRNALISCDEAMKITKEAYDLLFITAGPLNHPWNLEYTYTYLAVDNPHGITYPNEHRIAVRERCVAQD